MNRDITESQTNSYLDELDIPTREEVEEYSPDDEQDFLERELENKQ